MTGDDYDPELDDAAGSNMSAAEAHELDIEHRIREALAEMAKHWGPEHVAAVASAWAASVTTADPVGAARSFMLDEGNSIRGGKKEFVHREAKRILGRSVKTARDYEAARKALNRALDKVRAPGA